METQSDKIFCSQIPDEWIYRKIDLDYGLDREIEIVANGKLSGKTLLVQLKSLQAIDSKQNHIRYTLETDKLQYYLQRDVPVILVVVDLTSRLCYWLFVQEYVFEKLNSLTPSWREQKSVTLEIPKTNVWSNSLDAVKEIAKTGVFYLLVKNLSNIRVETTLKWKTDLETIGVLEDLRKQMEQKKYEIDLGLSQMYAKEGMEVRSREKLLAIYHETNADPLIRLEAISALLWHYVPTDKTENKMLFELAAEGRTLAEQIKHKPYALYFTGVVIQTAFFKIATDLSDQILLRKVSQDSKAGFDFMLEGFIQETWQKLSKLVRDFTSNLAEAQREKQFVIFTDLLRRSALMNQYLYQSLIVWVDSKQIDDLLVAAESSLDLSLRIAKDIRWEELECVILEDLARLYHFRNDVKSRRMVLKQCLEIAKKIGHKGLAEEVEEKYKVYEKTPFITGPKDISRPKEEDLERLSDEVIDKLHRMLLEAAGIDINGNDELAELARVGLKDRNPERVLKYCEHLYVEIISYGPIWDMVALPHTGSKLLYCEKKDCYNTGWRLDDIFDEFKQKNCVGCSYQSPRPIDWRYTYRWQKERKLPDRMTVILRNIRRWY